MAKETTRTGFVERATVEIIEPTVAVAKVACGWYWHNDQPVLVFEEGMKVMAKETTRTGFVERATVEIIEPTVAVAKVACGWYWHDGQPVLVFEEGMKIMARGYDFVKKEEWRVEASSLPLEKRIG